MIALLSPAKTLDFDKSKVKTFSTPRLLDQSEQLVQVLRKKKASDLKSLMGVSDKIATLNVERYQNYQAPFTLDNAKQAVLAFKGDVYIGLDAATLNKRDLNFAQKHLRILSGLYGLLTPLDLMQAYRLEMGTKLKNGRFKNLYEFWDTRITELINTDLTAVKGKTVVNLASKEYFQAVKPKLLNGQLIHVHFKELRNGQYKVISFTAKKARGTMARQIIQNRIVKVAHLKDLAVNDHVFNEGLSDEHNYYFTKD
ncbi:MAG: peroxide stress protein YaaA [Bacteroidota bacterium]